MIDMALVDYRNSNHQKIKNFYNADSPLDERQVLTFTNFANNKEADIEDMFELDFYLILLNGEFGTSLTTTNVAMGHHCILECLKEYFKKKSYGKQ